MLRRALRSLLFILIAGLITNIIPPAAMPTAQAAGLGMLRYEETAAQITTSGTWSAGSTGRASGGQFRSAKTTGNTASMTFDGTWVGLGLLTQTNAGKAEVFIDGSSRGVIDTYSSTDTVVSSAYGGLSAGSHTVSVTVLGQRNTNSNDSYIYLDYIDVWDGTAMSQGTIEQADQRVRRSSNWQRTGSVVASDGSLLEGGSNAWFPFTDTSVSSRRWPTAPAGRCGC